MKEDLKPAVLDELAPDKLQREGLFDPTRPDRGRGADRRSPNRPARPPEGAVDAVHVPAVAGALGQRYQLTTRNPGMRWNSCWFLVINV